MMRKAWLLHLTGNPLKPSNPNGFPNHRKCLKYDHGNVTAPDWLRFVLVFRQVGFLAGNAKVLEDVLIGPQ
jgi:hypothetical protein